MIYRVNENSFNNFEKSLDWERRIKKGFKIRDRIYKEGEYITWRSWTRRFAVKLSDVVIDNE